MIILDNREAINRKDISMCCKKVKNDWSSRLNLNHTHFNGWIQFNKCEHALHLTVSAWHYTHTCGYIHLHVSSFILNFSTINCRKESSIWNLVQHNPDGSQLCFLSRSSHFYLYGITMTDSFLLLLFIILLLAHRNIMVKFDRIT